MKMSLTIDQVARVCHEANLAYCQAIGDPGLPHWDDLEEGYRDSTRAGVVGVLKGSTPEQSHESWRAERIVQGWVWGTVLDRGAKVHPNLVPYDALPALQRIKDLLFLGIVKALSGEVQ